MPVGTSVVVTTLLRPERTWQDLAALLGAGLLVSCAQGTQPHAPAALVPSAPTSGRAASRQPPVTVSTLAARNCGSSGPCETPGSAPCNVHKRMVGWEGGSVWSSDGKVAFLVTDEDGRLLLVASPPDFRLLERLRLEPEWMQFVSPNQLALVTKDFEPPYRHRLQVLDLSQGTIAPVAVLEPRFQSVLTWLDDELITLESEPDDSSATAALRAYPLNGSKPRFVDIRKDIPAQFGQIDDTSQVRDGWAVLVQTELVASGDVATRNRFYRLDLRTLKVKRFATRLGGADYRLGPSGQLALTRPGAAVEVFDIRTGQRVRTMGFTGADRRPGSWARGSACTEFDATGERLAVAGYEQPTRWFDLKRSRLLHEVASDSDEEPGKFFGCFVSFSPDGQRVIQTDGGGHVSIWDATLGKVLFDRNLTQRDDSNGAIGNIEVYTSAAPSPTLSHLAVFLRISDSNSKPLTLMDLVTGVLDSYETGEGPAEFSDDGRYLIAGGIVWEIASRRRITHFETLGYVRCPTPTRSQDRDDSSD